jgi:predicted DNA-binding transcriptional regulator AlpA
MPLLNLYNRTAIVPLEKSGMQNAKQQNQQDVLMAADELASLLKIHQKTLYYLRKKPNFPKSFRVGNTYRWRTKDVMAYIGEIN